MARRPTRRNRGHGCAAGPSISPAIPTASRRPISTTSTGEFPRIDDRRAGLVSRHGWYACANPEQADARRALGHGACRRQADTRLGRYLLPAGDTISEPVFVARGEDAAEGDGWLLAVVWRARENRSDLAVFNATDVDAGPVALVQLGHRVPDGFHGNWVERGLTDWAAHQLLGDRSCRAPWLILQRNYASLTLF